MIRSISKKLKTKVDILLDTLKRKKKWVVFILCFSCFLWFTPWVFLLKFNSTLNVTHKEKKGLVSVRVGPKERSWVSLKKASRYAVSSIVVSEDSRFWEHSGIDAIEVRKSFELNYKRGYYARGASTITQQVVKLAFLKPEKSLLRKLREAWGAVLLELILSKDEILEWYINLTDFGEGIYGLRAASKIYFASRPESLSLSQGIHLALILPNPNVWSKGLRARNLTLFGHKRFAKILTFLLQNGYISKMQWHETMESGNFGSPIFPIRAQARPDDEEEDETE